MGVYTVGIGMSKLIRGRVEKEREISILRRGVNPTPLFCSKTLTIHWVFFLPIHEPEAFFLSTLHLERPPCRRSRHGDWKFHAPRRYLKLAMIFGRCLCVCSLLFTIPLYATQRVMTAAPPKAAVFLWTVSLAPDRPYRS